VRREKVRSGPDRDDEEIALDAVFGSYAEQLVAIEPTEKAVRSLLDRPMENALKALDWRFLVRLLLACGIWVWARAGSAPKALNPSSPLCLFAWHVLGFIGQTRGQQAVSNALKKASADAVRFRAAKDRLKKTTEILTPHH
jgi:hypothetical protein